MAETRRRKYKFSINEFSRYYNYIYKRADDIFMQSNLCQFKKNDDQSYSCITNRLISETHRSEFMETDGCCIELCKRPNDFNDGNAKRKQHSKRFGCLVKSLKCKLHICTRLNELSNEDGRKCIDEIEKLKKDFSDKYSEVWKVVPFGSAKSIFIKYFKKIYEIESTI